MILSFITLITFPAAKNSLNPVNENLIQATMNHLYEELIYLTIDGAEGIATSNNQTFETQNNLPLNNSQPQNANIILDPVVFDGNAQNHNMFINHYTNVAAAFQSLNIDNIRRLNNIYCQHLNNPYDRNMNFHHISQLNCIYEQYLADAYDNFAAAVNDLREMANEFIRLNNNLNFSCLENVIQHYYDLLLTLFSNSADRYYLDSIYSEYSNAIFYKQLLYATDSQSPSESDHQTLYSLNILSTGYLFNRSIYDNVYLQFMNDNCIEQHSTSYALYIRDIENHEVSVINIEHVDSTYDNYLSTLYHIFLGDLHVLFLRAIQEPLSRLNNPHQNTLFMAYIRNINNLYFGSYVRQYLNMIYNHYIDTK